jgi:hypothetical protein
MRAPHSGWILFILLILNKIGASAHPEAPALALQRTEEPVVVDGRLEEDVWATADVLDRFFEVWPGDLTPPVVRTEARFAYDDCFFYVAIESYDPDPQSIRAPYVKRDRVTSDQDYVEFFVDAFNNRRSAYQFRTNPRGSKGDATFNEDTGREDFSPDFDFDVASTIQEDRWVAEFRVPFSTLRFPKDTEQTWAVLVYRNRPRDETRQMASGPLARGANCFMCFATEARGIHDLARRQHFIMTPYLTGSGVSGDAFQEAPGQTSIQAGIDIKWGPRPGVILDGALDPDFSQVETDAAQLGANNRFALFFEEKRPFFLEGTDLWETPLALVYTRTITDPLWGARVTRRSEGSSQAVLVARDRGGGVLVLPGPTGSDLAPQDDGSTAFLARYRLNSRALTFGSTVTARIYDGTGHNVLFGPDLQWKITHSNQVDAQVVWSDTRDPGRLGVDGEPTRNRRLAHAGRIAWNRTTPTWSWIATYEDIGADFRADNGFIPRVGVREAAGELAYRFESVGPLSEVQPYLVLSTTLDGNSSRELYRRRTAGVLLNGSRGSTGTFEVHLGEKEPGRSQSFRLDYVTLDYGLNPTSWIPRVGVTGRIGDAVDLVNDQLAQGWMLGLEGRVRPLDALEIETTAAHQRLYVDGSSLRQGLFAETVAQITLTRHFSRSAFLRLIGQYEHLVRNAALLADPTTRPDVDHALVTLLLTVRASSQTALYVGGSVQAADSEERLDTRIAGQQMFAKVSYALSK